MTFTFDGVLNSDVTQDETYKISSKANVRAFMEGYNGTIFAYGQTGSGKTFTMMGVPDNLEFRGLIPNCFAHIFGCISTEEDPTKKYLVRCSYLEIYNEEIRDLLSKNPKNRLELKENMDSGV